MAVWDNVEDSVLIREDESDSDLIEMQVQFKVPKTIVNFIMWYCHLANIDTSRFFYSLIMHSLTEIVQNNEWSDDEAFRKMGVR